MEVPALQHQQIITSLLATQPESIENAAMSHWEKLAAEIVSIVGEAGFASLYERTLHTAESSYPWLVPAASPPQSPADSYRFVGLGTCLAKQAPAEARAAHQLMLTTFADILASLIGEQLTSSILRAAWGNPESMQASKELNHE